MKLLRQIPSIGPIRAALLVALLQTRYRFRTKRQLWAYIGLALPTPTSGEYRFERGQLQLPKKALAIRGLSRNHNHDLKHIFKGCGHRGTKPHLARLNLARKIAVITLLVLKEGVCFDAEHLKQ